MTYPLRGQPLKFAPRSVCDALDSTDVPSGAMAALTNLVPDPTSENLFNCRPASSLITNFSGFSNPGFISVHFVIGTMVYGLIATSRNAGRDEPFAYNLSTNTFVTVGGVIDATTTPTSPSATGVWTPPTMDLIGVKLVVTHPGFTGTGGVYFGWFDVSDPSAPTWMAGNLTGLITFTTPPSFVKNFNGRAYYIVNPLVGQPSTVFSDILDALTVTNANQALTYDDNIPLTALGALNLQNQLGGVVQALIVFKQDINSYQITGDAALSPPTLAKNALNIATGTNAPRSLASTPKGLAFVSPDGLRLIDFTAAISDPIGSAGQGISVPFIFSLVPSRIAAACSGNVLRISTQNGNAVGSPNQEYWLHFNRGIWTGPHTFPASGITAFGNDFILAPVGVPATLFNSAIRQELTSTFQENGVDLTYSYATSLLPDTDQMCENSIVESTLYMAMIAGAPVQVQALTQNATVIDSISVSITGTLTQWGQFQWGQALWQGSSQQLYPQKLNWTKPIVFRRMQITASGPSVAGFRIGRMHMRYEMLGYIQQDAA